MLLFTSLALPLFLSITTVPAENAWTSVMTNFISTVREAYSLSDTLIIVSCGPLQNLVPFVRGPLLFALFPLAHKVLLCASCCRAPHGTAVKRKQRCKLSSHPTCDALPQRLFACVSSGERETFHFLCRSSL